MRPKRATAAEISASQFFQSDTSTLAAAASTPPACIVAFDVRGEDARALCTQVFRHRRADAASGADHHYCLACY